LLLQTLQKLNKTLTPEFLKAIPQAFNMDPEQYITKDEFKMMLDVKES
jgi:hypothetical protein